MSQRIRVTASTLKALPIGAKKTISLPYIVADMIEALRLDSEDNVLETGSGYAVAVVKFDPE